MNKDIQIMKAVKRSELTRLKRIAEGTLSDEGSNNCPYCRMFMEGDCNQCPIKLRSGYPDCRLSPYAEWAKHQSESHFRTEPPYIVECDHCRELIKRVYEYTEAAPLFMEDQLEISM